MANVGRVDRELQNEPNLLHRRGACRHRAPTARVHSTRTNTPTGVWPASELA